MAEKYFVMKKQGNRYKFSEAVNFDSAAHLRLISNNVRFKILKLLKERPMYVNEIAKKLKVNEQNVYYHMELLVKADVVKVVDEVKIRGTLAKKYAPKALNFVYCLAEDWVNTGNLAEGFKHDKVKDFFLPFINDGQLNATFVVGNPDPHGPHKARARDGHYAIDLALHLGNYCSLSNEFAVKLDVDARKENILQENLIVVGGPVTNLVMAMLNDHMPIKFSDTKPWGVISKYDKYTDDAVGLVVRMRNPFNHDSYVLAIAGIRFIGTKAAIMALTRFSDKLLQNFHNQNTFAKIVQGFDLDGDGKIDTIEVLE